MTFMPPGEYLDGTTAERAHLNLLLACFRASPPPMRLPEVTGHPLPEVLAAGIIDPDLFRTGYAIMAARYEELGIRVLLPLERVWVGTSSAARLGTARSHGGFHHPAQGYRHFQMDAAYRTTPSSRNEIPSHQPPASRRWASTSCSRTRRPNRSESACFGSAASASRSAAAICDDGHGKLPAGGQMSARWRT